MQDIVFDGTMMHAPFVEQTIRMVRDHTHIYRRGPGYHCDDSGVTVERCGMPLLPTLVRTWSCRKRHTVGGSAKDTFAVIMMEIQLGSHWLQFV